VKSLLLYTRTYLLGRNLLRKSHYLHYPRDSKARYLQNTSSQKTRPANVVEQWCISNVHDGLSVELYSTTQMCNLLCKTQQTSTAAPIRNSSWGQSKSGRKRRLSNHHMLHHLLPRSLLHTYQWSSLHTTIPNLQHSSKYLYPTGDFSKSVSAMEMMQNYADEEQVYE
jgi:hypothetical protein